MPSSFICIISFSLIRMLWSRSYFHCLPLHQGENRPPNWSAMWLGSKSGLSGFQSQNLVYSILHQREWTVAINDSIYYFIFSKLTNKIVYIHHIQHIVLNIVCIVKWLLFNIHNTPHIYLLYVCMCMCLWWEYLKIYSLSNFQQYNVLLLTIVTRLNSWSLELNPSWPVFPQNPIFLLQLQVTSILLSPSVVPLF